MEHIPACSIHPAMEALVVKLGEMGAERVILYGSRARGDNMPRADIDIAVDMTEANSRVWYDMTGIIENAETLLPIDMVFLHQAPAPLKQNILRDGKVIYERH